MEATNLTNFQKGLLNDLTNEFTKLNPQKAAAVTTERFGVKTIEHCLNEKETFIKSVKEYNNKIAVKLRKELDGMLKEFDKEYKGLLYTECGINIPSDWNSIEKDKGYLFNSINTASFGISTQLYLNLKRIKPLVNTVQGNYVRIFVRFNIKMESITLKTKEQINLQKLLDLSFQEVNTHTEKVQFVLIH